MNASDSVIRQNTISNNDGYGIVIADQAFNNVIADSAIGTDIQEVGALGNGAGGVLLDEHGQRQRRRHRLHRLLAAAGAGGARQRHQRQRRPGVELDPGTNFNAVINNWIGLDVRGEGSLPNSGAPIDDDGGVNLIYGNLLQRAGAGGIADRPARAPLCRLVRTGRRPGGLRGPHGRAADAHPGRRADRHGHPAIRKTSRPRPRKRSTRTGRARHPRGADRPTARAGPQLHRRDVHRTCSTARRPLPSGRSGRPRSSVASRLLRPGLRDRDERAGRRHRGAERQDPGGRRTSPRRSRRTSSRRRWPRCRPPSPM